MTIEVTTSYLRGYADQIEANCDVALAEMAHYARAHCEDFEGLRGLLEATHPALTSMADSTVELIAAAQAGLGHTVEGLRLSATAYDRSDWAAAELQWLQMPGLEPPPNWRETDVGTTAPAPAGPAFELLVGPSYTPEGAEAVEFLKGAFGFVNDRITDWFGIDLLGTAMPALIGDWGALRRIAGAYRALEQAWREVAADLGAGMDDLSEHWDSSESGVLGASLAFDFHIRSRWMKAFEALAQMADTMEQMCESMAMQYEYAVKGLIFTLTAYLQSFVRKIGKFVTAVATDPLVLVTSLALLVEAAYETIQDAIAMMVEQVRMLVEGFEMLVAGAVMLRHRMNGDFDVLHE